MRAVTVEAGWATVCLCGKVVCVRRGHSTEPWQVDCIFLEVINIARLDDPSPADKRGGELKRQKKARGEIGEALSSEPNSQVAPIRSHMKPS